MAHADFGTGKSLVVLAIVVGCFAILWPKIFYPMMQTAFAMTSPKIDGDSAFKETERPPHLHPGSMNPRTRSSISEDVQDKFHMREGRPFPHPQARQPVKAQPKSGGAMSIIMPIYTVGIIVFFLYTVLKLVFKKPSENDKKPLIKDFHMDPEYRKFMCQQSSKENNKEESKGKIKSKVSETAIHEDQGQDLDAKDYEIFKLKKKLEETEQAMQRIMEHMGAMSACLSEKLPVEKDAQENSDVRLRHKGNSKKEAESEIASTNCQEDQGKSDAFSHESCKKLQEDLAKLISMSTGKEPVAKPGVENSTNKSSNEYSDGHTSENMYSGSEEEEENSEMDEHSSNEEKQNQDIFGKNPCHPNGCCSNIPCDNVK